MVLCIILFYLTITLYMTWPQSFLLFMFRWDGVFHTLRKGVLASSFPSFMVVELSYYYEVFKCMMLYFLWPTFSVLLPYFYLDLFLHLVLASLSCSVYILFPEDGFSWRPIFVLQGSFSCFISAFHRVQTGLHHRKFCCLFALSGKVEPLKSVPILMLF